MDRAGVVRRILIHVAEGRLEVVDPGEIYLVEAAEDDSLVRLRSATPLRDIRRFSEVVALLEPFGFLRIHRSYAVNLERVREIRVGDNGRDWEVKLEPPVNRVLPVGRSEVERLWEAYGESR